MAEYSREQRNQLSRAVTNNETGSRQSKEFMDNRCNIQMMAIGKPSSLHPLTRSKHLVALDVQQSTADNAYLHSTFFISDAPVRNAVDTNNHIFPESLSASPRLDINAYIPIYQYDKSTPGRGFSTTKSKNGENTLCEIGVIKNGHNNIVINHFKKV